MSVPGISNPKTKTTNDADSDVGLNVTTQKDIHQSVAVMESPPVSPAGPNAIIATYLWERVSEFRNLSELRQKTRGGATRKGMTFLRSNAIRPDKSDDKTAAYFYDLMKRIAHSVDVSTKAFQIPKAGTEQPRILDMCMAPGGFVETAMNLNPGAEALCFSLPASQGGHKVLAPKSPSMKRRFLDITMLAADMGLADADIPAGHPDAANFLASEFDPSWRFGLVICDGQVLRTHSRAEYREKREATRLTITQLALGLEHLQPGGTMVVLLHKAERWDTLQLIYRFSRFSRLRLFKPTIGHAKRSSFYMVATDVRSGHPEAVLAVQNWKEVWKVATFGTEEEYARYFKAARGVAEPHGPGVEEVLEKFGDEFVRLARKVWAVQAKALANAPFIKD